MPQKLKNYFSFFFLLLFLFPTVETQLHAFEHSSDVHCSASDKHFHTQEHHCSICDFTATDSNVTTDESVVFVVSQQTFSFKPSGESFYTPAFSPALPGRAPPVI